MTGVEITIGIVLLVMAVFLVCAVLMQSGKDSRMSGTIAGGAETFFGKNKGKSIDKLLSKLTIVVSALVVLCTIALVVITNNI